MDRQPEVFALELRSADILLVLARAES